MRCPRCDSEALDLRHAGFNAAGLERDRQCYVWSSCDYACNNPPPAMRGPETVFRHCFDGQREARPQEAGCDPRAIANAADKE